MMLNGMNNTLTYAQMLTLIFIGYLQSYEIAIQFRNLKSIFYCTNSFGICSYILQEFYFYAKPIVGELTYHVYYRGYTYLLFLSTFPEIRLFQGVRLFKSLESLD